MLAGVLAVLAVSPLANHRLLGARASHVERVLPLYDLAGIAHFGGVATLPRLPAVRWREAEAKQCYSPYRWDDYGDAHRCGFVADAVGIDSGRGAPVIGEWLRAVVAHPLAYARHRLGQFNATMRWIVPFGQPNAAAPPDSQPNRLGLGRRADPVLKGVAAAFRAERGDAVRLARSLAGGEPRPVVDRRGDAALGPARHGAGVGAIGGADVAQLRRRQHRFGPPLSSVGDGGGDARRVGARGGGRGAAAAGGDRGDRHGGSRRGRDGRAADAGAGHVVALRQR
jgi:hypothetical protein